MYSLKKIKEFDGCEGPGFSAEIFRDDNFIGNVVDEGNGGCFVIYMMQADRKQFDSDVAEWQKLRHAQNIFEPHDRFLEELLCLHKLKRATRRRCKGEKSRLGKGDWYAELASGEEGVLSLTGTVIYLARVPAGQNYVKL